VDLAKETIGYTANTQIHNPTDKMTQYGLDKLVGIPIPVYFRGTFAEPEYSVDWEGTLRKVAKQRIRQEQDKLREEAKQKLKEQEQKLKDKADQEKEEELRKLEEKLKVEQQKLKEKLKKLF
jgi:septin family protein